MIVRDDGIVEYIYPQGHGMKNSATQKEREMFEWILQE